MSAPQSPWNIEDLIRSLRTPQGVVSALTTLVSILGTVGILSTPFTTALQTLLAAVLGVVMVVVHSKANAVLIRRAAAARRL